MNYKNTLRTRTESGRFPGLINSNEEINLDQESIDHVILEDKDEDTRTKLVKIGTFINSVNKVKNKPYVFELNANKSYSCLELGNIIQKGNNVGILLNNENGKITLLYNDGTNESFSYSGKKLAERIPINSEIVENSIQKAQEKQRSLKREIGLL